LEEKRTPRQRLQRFALPVLGISLSVAGLIYVYRDFEFEAFLASITDIHIAPLLGTLISYWLGVVLIRSFLIRHLLKSVGNVPISGAYRFICIGFLANNVLPFRAGEMARSAAIHRGTGLRFSSVIGGLALERMLDMGMLALLSLLALQMAPLPAYIRNTVFGTALAVAAGLVIAVILSQRNWHEADARERGRIHAFIWNNWVRFSDGFGALARPGAIASAVALIIGIWACALLAMAFRLEALGIHATPALALTLLTCIGFGVAVPSMPGYAGPYHLAAAFALELHGVNHVTAGAFAMFSWVVDIGMGSAMGAVSLSIEGLRFKDLKRRKSLSTERKTV